jgi:hypothetical protein
MVQRRRGLHHLGAAAAAQQAEAREAGAVDRVVSSAQRDAARKRKQRRVAGQPHARRRARGRDAPAQRHGQARGVQLAVQIEVQHAACVRTRVSVYAKTRAHVVQPARLRRRRSARHPPPPAGGTSPPPAPAAPSCRSRSCPPPQARGPAAARRSCRAARQRRRSRTQCSCRGAAMRALHRRCTGGCAGAACARARKRARAHRSTAVTPVCSGITNVRDSISAAVSSLAARDAAGEPQSSATPKHRAERGTRTA